MKSFRIVGEARERADAMNVTSGLSTQHKIKRFRDIFFTFDILLLSYFLLRYCSCGGCVCCFVGLVMLVYLGRWWRVWLI